MRKAKDDEDEGKEEPLKDSCNLDGLGGTEDEALIVVVPSLRISSQTTNEQNIVKKPNHKRKERWIKLKEILDSNAKNLGSMIQLLTRMFPGIKSNLCLNHQIMFKHDEKWMTPSWISSLNTSHTPPNVLGPL
jgi:hypothetical protein